jgi:hypothetical protein
MGEKVLVKDVVRWLLAAIEAAEEDPGDTGGTTTALSYRELKADFAVHSGGITHIFVRTRNDGFSGNEWRTHRNLTSDGVVVLWEEGDVGIPTGADWLPEEFRTWMRGR